MLSLTSATPNWLLLTISNHTVLAQNASYLTSRPSKICVYNTRMLSNVPSNILNLFSKRLQVVYDKFNKTEIQKQKSGIKKLLKESKK